MDERALFTKFWEAESKTTATVISRIPEGNNYKPDPASRTAKEIAWQVICEERMIIDAAEKGEAAWAPPPMPATVKEVHDEYLKTSANVINRFKALSPDRWNGTLKFFGNDAPVSAMAWSFLFDIVHHRGQISTYLRPMGAKVPRIYGPSHDEP